MPEVLLSGVTTAWNENAKQLFLDSIACNNWLHSGVDYIFFHLVWPSTAAYSTSSSLLSSFIRSFHCICTTVHLTSPQSSVSQIVSHAVPHQSFYSVAHKIKWKTKQKLEITRQLLRDTFSILCNFIFIVCARNKQTDIEWRASAAHNIRFRNTISILIVDMRQLKWIHRTLLISTTAQA